MLCCAFEGYQKNVCLLGALHQAGLQDHVVHKAAGVEDSS